MIDQYKTDMTREYVQARQYDMGKLYEEMQNGSVEARDTLICSCLPLVIDIAKKFRKNNKHIDIEDMIQQGNIALIKAVDGWDISKAKLTTVATWCIRNTLIDMVKFSKYAIKNKFEISRKAAEDMKKIKAVDSNDVDVIQEATGLTQKRIKLLLRVVDAKRIGFSVYDFKLHSSDNIEDVADTNINGCLADLIELVEEAVEDEAEKEMFFCWLRNINKNNKARIAASEANTAVKNITATVHKTKRAVKKALGNQYA